MAGLPKDLLTHCYRVLSQCSEFDDNASLRSVFTRIELRPYRDGLKQPNDRQKRIEQNIDYLLDIKTEKGQAIFPIFIETLMDRCDKQTSLWLELNNLYQEISKIFLAQTEIPIVIFAMVRHEAEHLFSESVFDGSVASDDRPIFQSFKRELQNRGIKLDNLLENYHPKVREQWRPPTYLDENWTIQDAVENVMEKKRSAFFKLSPSFPKFFEENFNIQKRLSELPCIVIIDAISIFHPSLRKTFVQSEIGGKPHAAILIISPINTREIDLEKQIHVITQKELVSVYNRFDTELDGWCELGIGALRDFQRKLFSIITDVTQNFGKLSPNEETKNQIWGKDTDQPKGVHKPIYQSWGQL